MKIPFSVLYFEDIFFLLFLGVRDREADDTIAEDKSSIFQVIIIGMYASESLLVHVDVFQRHGSLPLCILFLRNCIRPQAGPFYCSR
jgi:hypothetical protein